MKLDLNVVAAVDYMLLAAAVLSVLAAILLIMILVVTFVDNAAKKKEDAKATDETKNRVEAKQQALIAATEAAEAAKLAAPPVKEEKPVDEENAEQSGDAVEVESTAVEEFEETRDETESTESEERTESAEQGPIEMSVNDFKETLADEEIEESEKEQESEAQDNAPEGGKESAKEAPAAAREEVADKGPEKDIGVAATVDEGEERVIYRYSVRGKIVLSSAMAQNYVGRIEDELRSYSAIVVSDGWMKVKFEAGMPKKTIAHLMFRKKTPRLALNLDPAACELGMAKDMSAQRRFRKTPVVIDLRSKKAVKDACRLIALAMEGIESEKTEVAKRSYIVQREEPEAMVEKGLARSRVGRVRRPFFLFGNRSK